MSRLAWAGRKQQPSALRQTTLTSVVVPTAEARKRSRTPTSDAVADDAVMWGPSGGNNRETQGKKPFQPARPSFVESSPYSRTYVDGWRKAAESGAPSTSFDDDLLLEEFIGKDCPKDLFCNKCFFLNSCDSDASIPLYYLEKVIRALGGSTSMGPAGVDYIVAQHLCSAKVRKASSGALSAKYVTPQFVLECAKAGKLVREEPFLSLPHMNQRVIEL
jgi:hypothetical protein